MPISIQIPRECDLHMVTNRSMLYYSVHVIVAGIMHLCHDLLIKMLMCYVNVRPILVFGA